MKNNFSLALGLALLALTAILIGPSQVLGEQSNFQIAPPPIAYPYFEPGRLDGKIEPIFVGITAKDISLSGGGVNLDIRQAFSEFMAMDMQAGIFLLSGEMPGIPPITPIPAYSTTGSFGGYYTTRVDGKAKVSMTSMAISANLELQPIHGKHGGIIIFGGPNIGIMSMDMKTPYSLIVPPSFSNAGQVRSGYTDTLTISSSTAGFQFGLQGDIHITGDLKLSPFFMTSSTSGSATLKDNPGAAGVSGYSSTADIPTSSSSSLGMDIIIGNLSIGTVLQEMKSQEKGTEDINITLFRLGYHF